ncbi:ABC transporter substrate-binding protein [Sinosporangium siamense]|uniref:ABC transporter substrate-binding protein n=1 Tax=Sinosporangium siamense TaxID=1367973 RepID=A0A919RM46_9ACTN|nr:ABC transporter substrate-binding protein [Sinosporangium siamense]GII96098.1 ABC transporter substrate-binding protein [Sinosporangium siamense]
MKGPSAAVLALAVLAAAAACGAPESAKSKAAQAAEAKLEGRGPITFVAGKDPSGSVRAIVDAWNAAHPQEKVDFQEPTFETDQFRAKVAQAAEAKSDTFSVISMDVILTGEFAKRGYIVPLPEEALDRAAFLPAPLSTATFDGKLYGVPWKTDTGLLFYRKDLLEKHGVEPPTTWEELGAACEKVAKAEKVDCYAGQHKRSEGLTVNVTEVVASAGGAILTDGRPTADTPEAVKGLTFLADAFTKGWIAKEGLTYDEEIGRARFQSGKLLFQRNWPYMYPLADKKGDGNEVAGKFGVVPIPGLSGPGSAALGGQNLAVSAFAKNKATALDFLKFFTAKENQIKNLQVGAHAPVLAAVYDDPGLKAEIPYLATLKAALDKGVSRPAAAQYQEVSAAVQAAGVAVQQGEKTPEQAAKDLQAALTPLFTN